MSISEEAYTRLKLEEELLSTQSNRDNPLIALGFSKRVDTTDSIEVFLHFISSVNHGITPTADVLAFVAKGLTEYITNPTPIDNPDQKLKSLDECFDLKPKQRVGHPVEHRVDRCMRIHHLYDMWQARKQSSDYGNPISIEDAAGIVINYRNLDIGEDILKKEYIAYGGDAVIGQWGKQNKSPMTLIKKGKQ